MEDDDDAYTDTDYVLSESSSEPATDGGLGDTDSDWSVSATSDFEQPPYEKTPTGTDDSMPSLSTSTAVKAGGTRYTFHTELYTR